jgi:hypothetical protein
VGELLLHLPGRGDHPRMGVANGAGEHAGQAPGSRLVAACY